MTRNVSIGTMIEQIDGLRDTDDLSEWEQGFATNIIERYLLSDKDTRWMSSKQVDIIERIWQKHFA
jgi:hypothetical protein